MPVRPTIELGDYESVRVEREPYNIPEDEVDKALEELRQRYSDRVIIFDLPPAFKVHTILHERPVYPQVKSSPSP